MSLDDFIFFSEILFGDENNDSRNDDCDYSNRDNDGYWNDSDDSDNEY